MSILAVLPSSDASACPKVPTALQIQGIRRRAKEVCRLVRALNVPDSADLFYLSHRRFAINMILILLPLERILYPKRKVRSSVQIAATLYREMHLRAETLCEEYKPSAITQLMLIS